MVYYWGLKWVLRVVGLVVKDFDLVVIRFEVGLVAREEGEE